MQPRGGDIPNIGCGPQESTQVSRIAFLGMTLLPLECVRDVGVPKGTRFEGNAGLNLQS